MDVDGESFAGADAGGDRVAVVAGPGRVAVRRARLLRRGADAGDGDHDLRRARSDARDRGVPQRGAGRVAGGDAARAAVGRASRRRASSAYTDPRANSGALFLTPNTETTYGTTMLDLQAWGPTVIEAPPESLCVVDDFWFRYVADMGIAGPDRGEGGKYLFLPPGYDGEVPDGYFTLPLPDVHQLGGAARARRCPGDEADQDLPARRGRQPGRERVRQPRRRWCSTPSTPTTSRSIEEVDELVQEEPVEALDAERAGQLAAIGIVKGQPFAPDDRMRGDPRRRRPDRRRHGASASPTRRATRTRCSTARGRTRSSAAATSSCATAPDCWMPARSSTTSPPSSPRPWRTPRSAPGPRTPTPCTTPTATCSTAPAPTGCTSTRTRRRRTSGRSTSTTPRPAR